MSPVINAVKKRRVPRRQIRVRIGLLVHGEYTLSWGLEIGEGGMLLISPKPLNVGDKVVITCRIPEVLHGVMLGSVAYALPGENLDGGVRCGIQFEDIEFDVKRKIRNFVASSNIDSRKGDFGF